MQKHINIYIDQSLPLAHKHPPDLFLSLASTQDFSFLVVGTTRSVVMFVPFPPADVLSSFPPLTSTVYLFTPSWSVVEILSLSGTPRWAESLSRVEQFKRLPSQELSVGFPGAQKIQRIKWPLLPSLHLWCTDTRTIHRTAQSWVWTHCLTKFSSFQNH